MELKDLCKPLAIKDIDFRIQSINKWKYATILAYKDARVDMKRLDEVVWAWLWKREHFDNNKKCKVSIYNTDIKEWVSKEDVWTASNTEAEKWLASDSFKRACFNWGIWRELYDFPVISIKLEDTEVQESNWKFKASFWLKLKEWIWTVENKDNWVVLSCKDQNWKERFNSLVKEKAPYVEPSKTVTPVPELNRIAQDNIDNIEALLKAWAKVSFANIKSKYKISRVNRTKIEELWIK